MKKLLEKRLARLMAKKAKLVERSNASTDVNEVRAINEQLNEINEDIVDVQDGINALGESDGSDGSDGSGESRSVPPTAVPVNSGITASFGQNPPTQRSESPYATMEYREAFKNYVQKGTPIPVELRAGGDTGTTVAADIGMIIPQTIMQEFIKEVSKVYGQVYGKVRKLNIKGGVKFPISQLSANFHWITETTVSNKQKAGDIDTYIEFSYNIGEIRVASTLLSQVVSLPLFESEITRIMLEAYVKAMDVAIISGTGVGQPLGITADTRVTNNSGHTISFTEAEFKNWTKWREKLFSVIPLPKRGQGEFLFAPSTVESYLLTMEDTNHRPIFKEATELTVGDSSMGGKFFGRQVTLVEPDLISDFATANSGDVVGIYWVPSDYAINTNLQFGMKRYFDEDTNEWINKGLTIVDGKMLDVSGIYLITKA